MQQHLDLEERDFFRFPFSPEEIKSLLHGRSAKDMFNPRSPEVKKRGLSPDQLTDEDLISLMIEEPRLIKRPIVVIGKETYFGADTKTLAQLFK
ncbi:MAG: hypothetical protein N2572_08480 [Syntrophales bacterium]|nr:hypothetical protein [Syntrophales bacterium]